MRKKESRIDFNDMASAQVHVQMQDEEIGSSLESRPLAQEEKGNQSESNGTQLDEAFALALAEEEAQDVPVGTVNSFNLRSQKALQDDAELKLLDALMEAEQSNDLNAINATQEAILNIREEGQEYDSEAPSSPASSVGVPEGSDASFSSKSSRFSNLRRKSQDPGLSEEEMLAILESSEEEDHIVHLKVALDKREGETFFEEYPDMAMDLDFWCRACLRARRFRATRSLELLSKYAKFRKEVQHLMTMEAKKKVRAILESGIIVFLGGARCKRGRGVLLVRMGLHDPKEFAGQHFLAAAHEVTTHAIRRFPRLQATGFTIVCDLTGVTTRNLDYKVPRLLSRHIESRLPIRYGSVIVVNPPGFFATVFRIVSFFMSSKMRARMVRLYYKPGEKNSLEKFISKENLPVHLGGARKIDHINFAASLVPLADINYDESHEPPPPSSSDEQTLRQSAGCDDGDDDDEFVHTAFV